MSSGFRFGRQQMRERHAAGLVAVATVLLLGHRSVARVVLAGGLTGLTTFDDVRLWED
jgi:hypothetical protein